MYWYDIPYQVKAEEGLEVVKKTLPARFMQAINSAAVARQKHENNAYTNGWRWSKRSEQQGTAEEIAACITQELSDTFDQEALRQLIIAHANHDGC